MTRREQIAGNLHAVHERVEAACAAADRPSEQVTLIVVTKFHPASDIAHLVDLGITDIAENRDQEASAKVAELDPAVRAALNVHFVGQLQTNKARHVVEYADCVQSVDRAKLVGALDRAAAAARGPADDQKPGTDLPQKGGEPRTDLPQKWLDVLLQVDLGEGEDAGRGGAPTADLSALAARVADAEHLVLRGVMAVAPLGLAEADAAAAFGRLADLAADLREDHPGADIVSAGMSGDLELAIAAGATHLRVGTAILGSRPDPR